jgi:hypothetical protein
MPWEGGANPSGGSVSSNNNNNKALQPGDTDRCVGSIRQCGETSDTATLGYLQRARYNENVASLAPFVQGRSNIKLFDVDLLNGMKGGWEELDSCLGGGSCNRYLYRVQQPFPTKAWSRTGETDICRSGTLDILWKVNFQYQMRCGHSNRGGVQYTVECRCQGQ